MTKTIIPMTSGYAHPAYADSLAEFGRPRQLEHSGGWVLERPIPDTTLVDAIGCYPFFACQNWRMLGADLESLAPELVCLSLVTDPFGDFSVEALKKVFPDRVLAFKEHFIADLSRPADTFISKHHRYYSQRSLTVVNVERVANPAQFANEWISLYEHLISRHELRGIKAFSPRAFEKQLRVPGIILLRATFEEQIVGAHLWFADGDVIHSHLLALSKKGYELMASYALYRSALELFRGEARWLNFGAGAGLASDEGGLARFKAGWATGTRTAYLCGRILNTTAYEKLASGKGENYFPAYRKGEFT